MEAGHYGDLKLTAPCITEEFLILCCTLNGVLVLFLINLLDFCSQAFETASLLVRCLWPTDLKSYIVRKNIHFIAEHRFQIL